MTEDDYKTEIGKLLKTLGGSYLTPCGWSENSWFFNCDIKTIEVFMPHLLTPEQRQVVVDQMRKRYLDK